MDQQLATTTTTTAANFAQASSPARESTHVSDSPSADSPKKNVSAMSDIFPNAFSGKLGSTPLSATAPSALVAKRSFSESTASGGDSSAHQHTSKQSKLEEGPEKMWPSANQSETGSSASTSTSTATTGNDTRTPKQAHESRSGTASSEHRSVMPSTAARFSAAKHQRFVATSPATPQDGAAFPTASPAVARSSSESTVRSGGPTSDTESFASPAGMSHPARAAKTAAARPTISAAPGPLVASPNLDPPDHFRHAQTLSDSVRKSVEWLRRISPGHPDWSEPSPDSSASRSAPSSILHRALAGFPESPEQQQQQHSAGGSVLQELAEVKECLVGFVDRLIRLENFVVETYAFLREHTLALEKELDMYQADERAD